MEEQYKVFALLLMVLCLNTDHSLTVASEYDEVCSLFKDGMIVQKPASCTDFIMCQNSTAQMLTCAEPLLYDRSTQSCATIDLESRSTEENNCRNRCEGKNKVYVADPASCDGYYYCDNSQPLYAKCPNGLYFNEASTMCTYPSSDCLFVSSFCELVPEGTTFRDDTNCNQYFQCTKNKLVLKQCKITKKVVEEYYDDELGKCVDKKLVNTCTAHPIPADLCGTVDKPLKGLKPDGATCHGFFYCKDLGVVNDIQPSWHSCPEGFFFSEEEQGCTDPLNASCAYNRCYGRGNKMVQSNGCYCHDYIVCENNKEIGNYKCIGDKFFNEPTQSCVTMPTDFKCCDKATCTLK